MGLFDLFARNSDNYTQEMRLALKDKERTNKMLVDLQLKTEMLTKKDVGLWRMAWQKAINVENPKRASLYDVYTDVDIDLHLSGCVGQRKGFATKGLFKLVDKNGKANDIATELLEAEWFYDFMELVLDSRYWGHSLIEFGQAIDIIGGNRRFSDVKLVPRRHVIPEFGVIVKEINDEPKDGYDYRNSDLSNWCIEVGKPHDLGLYLKCAPSALSKKNMYAFWDGFGEIFGMPIRIAKTTSRDKAELNRIEQMLAKMGAAFYGLFQEGTEIEIKESQRGDAFNVYDKRIDKANYEMSKGILNQTMTIDNGASLSQSQIHLEVFENVVEKDKQLIANTVNDKLIPFMCKHGFKVDGLRFMWDDSEEYSPETMKDVEGMILNAGYDVDPKYFIDKYNIPITGKKKETLSFFD